MNYTLIGRAFVLLWLSEAAFVLGGTIMSFAVGVWVFEQSGSVKQFSYVMLSSAIPSLVFLPTSGVLADRFDRRWIIALCDCGITLIVIVLAYLAFQKQLLVEHFYIFSAVLAVLSTLRQPSYQAIIGLIVPNDKLGRANGLLGFTQGFVQIGAPLAAGYLMATWGLEGVIAIEMVTVIVGGLAIFVALTTTSRAIRGDCAPAPLALLKNLRSTYGAVIEYFKTYKLMLGLVAYLLIQEGLLVLSSMMITPLVLATHSSETLGMIMAFGAFGSVTGSLLLIGANVKKRLMLWILVSDTVLATFVILAGISVTTQLWCLAAFGAFACGAISKGCSGALRMRKVPAEKQGSVFASIASGCLIVMCTVMLIGSTTVDQLFEPLMMPGAPLANYFGDLVGTGKGRGVALLFVLAGAIFASTSLIAIVHPRLRHLDDWVPDKCGPRIWQNPSR